MKSLSILVIAIFAHGAPAQADPGFDRWVKELKVEARSRGISSSLLEQAFQDVKPLPRVLELDRKQPESTMSFVQYKQHIISPKRIQRGREMLAQHRDVLTEVGQHYGVPPRFIVALWGIETSYGSNTGGFKVIEALATLAYDGRRSQYFRSELLNALQILQEGHASIQTMKGSWAGAMGQSQFMPSSFLKLAVDFDRDGRKDIWTTHADVFASAANYLSQSGWRTGETWGRKAKLPEGFDHRKTGLKISKSLQTWQTMGVRRGDGRNLPIASMKCSIILPDNTLSPAFLVYHNFRVLMRWNRSIYFATSVGLLADAIVRPQ
jgi:membrane-bound lytic murein transglycosylase B